ncbi:MAG TPA: EsaB/YukD family protein [Microlunatus sp.]|nr:EsaB/YukD family protein [Microlunatus sp.]
MAEFTRLTIIGGERKADLVIPNDEAVGVLLPRLMDLLGESAGSAATPLTLVRTTGEQLDLSRSAAEQQLADGDLVRLLRADEAPPPPEVADVTDVLGETLADRPGVWSDGSRRLTGLIVLGVLGCLLTALVQPGREVLATGYGVLAVIAVLLGRSGPRWGAQAITAALLGAAVPAGALISGWAPFADPVRPLGWLCCTAAVAWIAIGIGFGVGLGRLPALWGALAGTVLATLPLLLGGLGLPLTGVAAITAATAIVVCGLLPRYALTASGLTGLDDQVVDGQPRRRDEVIRTVADAYQALTWSTFAVALPLAVAAGLLLGFPLGVEPADQAGWATALGLVILLVTALRTRSFPLAAQQCALWFAVLLGGVAGLLGHVAQLPGPAVIGIVLAAAAVTALLVLLRPAAHQRAFWRRLGNLAEAVGVIALIPLLLGVFGVYSDLLGAF